MLRLKSDLLGLIDHALAGTLDQAEAEWDTRVALGVVLAAGGYPETPRTGHAVEGLPQPGEDFRVFHAGTRLDGDRVTVSGGRVLCVTALGHNVRTAQQRAYEIVSRIHFDGVQYRRDIGARALERRRGSRKADVPPPAPT
jgi:phosphoribosylamine--glycine ligase